MPSLNELKEFKASFHHVGGQKANLAAKNIPFDDMELPSSEPEPLPGVAEEPIMDPAAGIDFSAFLDTDLPEDDINPPEGLISNLSEELDAIPPESSDEPPAPAIDLPPLDLDSLDNFDMPEEPIEAIGADEPPVDEPPLEEPAAASGDESPVDEPPLNLDDFNLPEEPIEAAAADEPPVDEPSLEEPAAASGDESPVDEAPLNLDDFDMPEEPAAAADGDESPADDPPLNLDDFDMPEEPIEAAAGDDSFNLDNLDIPDEPATAADASESLDLDNLGDLGDLPEEPAAATDASESLDLDNLGDLGDLPEEPATAADANESFDLDNLGDLGDLPEEPAAVADASESLDLDNLGDLGDLPDEPATAADESGSLDLDNLGDLGDLPDEPATAADASESLDLDNLGDLGDLGDLPEEPAAATDASESLDIDNLGDLGDLPEEPAAAADESGSLDLDNLGDLGDMSDEPAAATDESESPDLDNLGDLGDLPEEPAAAADESGSLDLDNLGDLGDMSDEPAAATDESENLDLDNLGDLDLAGESEGGEDGDINAYDNIELDNIDDADFSEEEKPAAAAPQEEDISFNELDDVLQKAHKKKAPGFAAGPAAAAKTKQRGKKPKAERKKIDLAEIEDTSEIQITEDELEGILETLSHYPLNLRIACEEIIANEVGSTKQIAELLEHLIWGASARETASIASHILDRTIIVPKAFEKSSGAELEAEQASFSYIFVHRFLPVLRICTLLALLAASCCYLFYRFVYNPLKAESIYKIGYERIFAGEYQRANERFDEAFNIHRKKAWFYKYAEAFRDERQYIYAEQKYDELLQYYPRDKKGVLDYAYMETNYLRNYSKADDILRWNLLDYNPNDREGLLAAGDNCLVWGDVEPEKYEDARYYYARVLEKYGWQPPVVERMMKYFIRTDNLREVLPLKVWFDNNSRYELSAETLGELGGYLLDKQLEEVKGVPNEYVEQIGSVRDLLLKAVYSDPTLPEPHYHLARYYQHLGSAHEELVSLRVANRMFDEAPEGSVRRVNYRLDAIQRYADALINDKQFFPAEENLVKGINLYEDAVSRRLISRSAKNGRLYAVMGDLEYFTKTGDMEAALRFYHRSEQDGWAPPEMQYRMGAAYYQLENWRNALEYLFAASKNLPLNRRILFALGNTALKRGDYFAANGYYNRLLDILETQRARLPILLPNDRPEYLELAERLLMAQNNAGVANEMLAAQTGSRSYRNRALAFYAEANRAWDARTRDPRSMIRSGSSPLPFLNSRNALYPQQGYEPQIFIRIDREVSETSPWESLAALPRPDFDRND